MPGFPDFRSESPAVMERSAADFVLDSLQLSGTFFCRNDMKAPWGYWFGEATAMTMHIALEGTCYLHLADQNPVTVQAGDIVLLPGGVAHGFSSDPRVSLSRDEVVPGGDPADNTLLCGGVSASAPTGQMLLSALPDLVHVPAEELRRCGVLELSEMLTRELLHEPMSGGIATRLYELIFLNTLRAWLRLNRNRQGWLSAAADEVVGAALVAIHSQPEKGWTLESLARVAGASRSSLSARFSALLGRSPIDYLTGQRMHLAAQWLRSGSYTVSESAERLCYNSEPAFRRAFKRHLGYPPGMLSRR